MLRRMISAGILVTVGAVASAAAVHARCPEALKAVGAALTALGSLAGNVFATDLHNALTRRSRSPRDEAVNHDILRAIGRAIAMLLESAAQDAEPTGADNRLRRALALGADDTRALRSMAKAVPAWWVGWATVSADSPPEAAPDDADVREKIAAMARADTAGSGGACEIPGVTLAPEAFWKSALDALAVQASVKPTEDLLERVAKRLETELPWYLREVLKEDAVAGGKAYPALMLDMMGSILGSVSEIMTGLNALSDDERQRHAEVMRALDALAQNARDQGRTLAARLDESQYAQLKEQWDKIDAQYDSIVKELKDLGEKVDNVGEKLEDIGEKFESLQATLVAKGDAPIGPPPVAPIPEPGALAVYEPRDAEKDAVAAAMFRADGSFGVGALVGMAGVGKTYLAELIAWERRDRLPGGMLRLELEPGSDAREDELAAELCARYGVTVSGGMDPALALRARLACPLSMLLIENVDAHEQVAPVSALIKALPGIPALITGRCVTLRNVRGWTVRELEPFDRKQSDSLLDREMGAHASRLSEEDRRRLFDDLGGVPLAIGIAASHIRRIGGSASAFLDDFHRSKAGIAHAPGSDQERNLRAAIEVSVGALKAAEGQDAVAGLARMAFGPAAGMGADLARTASGLDNDSFRDCCASASELSLLRLREGDSGIEHVGFHPLVAEVLRDHGDESAALEAMTDWFVQHLPEGVDDQGERWGRIQAELPALERWLGAVPEGRLREAGRAGSRYAIFNGPYRWWAPLCERLIASGAAADRSIARWTLGTLQYRAGDLDGALATAQAMRREDAERGAERDAAFAAGLIAGILFSRGDLDEALRIRREEELPVYERLGDVRSRALTMGKIADILQSRGDLDEALRILREDALPAFERLGAVRERALTMGRIADILRSRGDLDEALRILREEALPVYERLGDVHSRAVTMGRIADILFSRGDLDEALRILREEALPVYERLGDVRALLEGRVYLAFILKQRGKPEDGPEIERLMRQALADARRLRIPEAEQIQGFMREMGIAP